MKLRDAPSDQKFLDFSDEPEVNRVPLETPSHNGEWKGKIPVRVIPSGVAAPPSVVLKFGRKAKEKQSVIFAERARTISEHQSPRQKEAKRLHAIHSNNEASKRYRQRAGFKAKQRMKLGPMS